LPERLLELIRCEDARVRKRLVERRLVLLGKRDGAIE